MLRVILTLIVSKYERSKNAAPAMTLTRTGDRVLADAGRARQHTSLTPRRDAAPQDRPWRRHSATMLAAAELGIDVDQWLVDIAAANAGRRYAARDALVPARR